MKRRTTLLKYNIIMSLLLQITTVVCGMILPRLYLIVYGSKVNGAVNSIAQFLGVITFFEMGIGAVVQSALYKPLAEKDYVQTSKIMASAQKFFNKLARLLLVYVILLMAVYPYLSKTQDNWVYTATLIAVMSISSFAQYYFGIANSLLLSSDQYGYIQDLSNIVAVVLNTLCCIILINAGAGIHFVKLATSAIYLIRPVFLHWYVDKHYCINRKIEYDVEPIAQKWNGVAQHISAIVLGGTDSIVLTMFASLSSVSIYSVYFFVVNGLLQLLGALSSGIDALIGEIWAKQEQDHLQNVFSWMEWIMHTGVVFVFGCTAVLIVPFVTVYTKGVDDVNYVQPLFAAVLTAAYGIRSLRIPYNVMILAAGHYKQTQHNYIIAALMNLILSIATVVKFGLVGVAIGTFAAMLYQTVWMAFYVSKHLTKLPIKIFAKHVLVDAIGLIGGILATQWIALGDENYVSWVIMAIKTAAIWFFIVIVVNIIFYNDYTFKILELVKRKIIKNENQIEK